MVLVQIPIAADSLLEPLRALTVFRTPLTHRLNLEVSRFDERVTGVAILLSATEKETRGCR